MSLSASPLLDASREELCRKLDFECGACYFKCSDAETLKIHQSSVHKPPTYDLFVQDFVSLGAQIKEHMRIESDSDQSDTFLCENIFSSVNKVQTFVMTHELL